MHFSPADRRNVLQLLNVTEAAREIGVEPMWMHRRIRQGYIPPPSIEVGKRKYYTVSEVSKIAKNTGGMN